MAVILLGAHSNICTLTSPYTGAFSEMYALTHTSPLRTELWSQTHTKRSQNSSRAPTHTRKDTGTYAQVRTKFSQIRGGERVSRRGTAVLLLHAETDGRACMSVRTFVAGTGMKAYVDVLCVCDCAVSRCMYGYVALAYFSVFAQEHE